MKEIVATLIEKYGSQVKAANALGVSDRTFRNYVRFPQRIPHHMQNYMRVLIGSETPPSPTPPAEPACEVRP